VIDVRAVDGGAQDIAGEERAGQGGGRSAGIDRAQRRRGKQTLVERRRARRADRRRAGEQREQRRIRVDPEQADRLEDEAGTLDCSEEPGIEQRPVGGVRRGIPRLGAGSLLAG
jgi:hypothetical protein